MKKSKKAKRERFVQIPWRILDANLPPAAYYALTRLWKMADWHTGRVPYTSAKDLETLFHGALSARTIQDELKRLDDAGYITRLIPVGCAETYPVDISNYDAVDEKFRWKGVVNKRKVEALVEEKKLRPAKNAAPKDVPPAEIAQGASVGASGGASDPPLQNLQTNQDSFSSSSKLERSGENNEKLLKAVSAVPPAAVVTASLLQTTKNAKSADVLPGETKPAVLPKAEMLARYWWTIQGKRNDQIESIPAWSTRFQGLLGTYPDLEPALVYWWNRDPWWGKPQTNPHPMLRYESDGDSLDWFETKLDVPEDKFKSLWWLFRRYENRLKKNNKPLPLLPVEPPVAPTPVPVAKAKVLSTPPTPPAPPVAPPRPSSDDFIEDIDDLPESSLVPVAPPPPAG